MLLAFTLIFQRPSIEIQLEKALLGVRSFDHSFHAAIGPVLSKNNFDLVDIKRPIGGTNARIIEANDSSSPAFGNEKSFIAWPMRGHISVQALWGDYHDPMQHAIGDSKVAISGSTMVVCGELQDDTNAPRPAIRAYRLKAGKWEPFGTRLGDAEEASPPPHFLRRNGRIDPERVAMSTRPYPKDVMTAHAGPHLLFDSVYKVSSTGITCISYRRRPTAMAALEDIAAAVTRGDRRAFNRMVGQRFRSRLWHTIHYEKGNLAADNLGDDTSDLASSFEISEAMEYVIHFRKRNGRWQVAGLQ